MVAREVCLGSRTRAHGSWINDLGTYLEELKDSSQGMTPNSSIGPKAQKNQHDTLTLEAYNISGVAPQGPADGPNNACICGAGEAAGARALMPVGGFRPAGKLRVSIHL